MIPKKPVPDLIRDGHRFSEKIMLKQNDKRSVWFSEAGADAEASN